MKLYGHYKTTFGIEMRLTNANMTYEEAEYKARRRQEESDKYF